MDRKDAIAWMLSACAVTVRYSQAKTLMVLVLLTTMGYVRVEGELDKEKKTGEPGVAGSDQL